VRLIVGIAEMRLSSGRADQLVTHALGSCLGITIYDPVAAVGGMLHVMLPQSSIDPEKAADNPSMFVDTGVPQLFMESYRLGAQKNRLEVKVAGGASTHGNENDDCFQIGKRNIVMLHKLLWKNGVLVKSEDVGGNASRTMCLDLADGSVTLRIHGAERAL
jgi:chemotaxis protein CheD